MDKIPSLNWSWQDSRKRFKEIWITQKRRIIWSLILLFVAFCIRVGVHGYDFFKEEWQKVGSPYDVQWEFQLTRIYSTFCYWLSGWGFADDNFISLYLKKRQAAFIEKIRQVVGDDDMIVDYLEFERDFYSTVRWPDNPKWMKNNEVLNKYINKNFKRILDKQSNLELKFEIIDNIENYIRGTHNTELLKLVKLLLESFINSNKDQSLSKISRFYLYYSLSGLYQEYLIQKYQKSNWIPCDDVDYIKFKKVVDLTRQTLDGFTGTARKTDRHVRWIIDGVQYVNDVHEFDKYHCPKL